MGKRKGNKKSGEGDNGDQRQAEKKKQTSTGPHGDGSTSQQQRHTQPGPSGQQFQQGPQGRGRGQPQQTAAWSKPPQSTSAWGPKPQQQPTPPPGLEQTRQHLPPQQPSGWVAKPQVQPALPPSLEQTRQHPPPQQPLGWGAKPQVQPAPPPGLEQTRQQPPPQQPSAWGTKTQQQQPQPQIQTSSGQQMQTSHQKKSLPKGKQQERKEKTLPETTTRVEPVCERGFSESMKTLSLEQDRQLTVFKSGGLGRKIPIATNHLQMDLGKNRAAIHYDVTITPDKPRNLLDSVMEQFRKENYPNRFPAYDGNKNLYTPTKLPFGDAITGTVKVQADNGVKEFKVEIKFAANIDLSPLTDMMKDLKQSKELKIETALNCLGMVFRTAAAKSCIRVGRSFFTPPRDQIITLGQGMQMYHGFFQSVIRGWTSYLNVDVAHKAFPSAINVLDLICELNETFRNKFTYDDLRRELNDYQKRDLEKFLKGLKVSYEISNQPSSKRVYRVNGLDKPPSQARFRLDNGPELTVAQYFEQNKRVKLRYPHLPTLWVGSRDKKPKILVPIEFCTVVANQAVQRKLNENQTSSMIKVSATSTDIRREKIMRSLQQVQHNSDPCVKEFGLKISQNFTQLTARVLEPPSLEYANEKRVKPFKGVWRMDNSRFLKPSKVKKWTILSVCRYPQRMDNLADDFCKMARGVGMEMPPVHKPFQEFKQRINVNVLRDYFKTKTDFDLILVVVPNSGPEYSWVKTAAEINVGCLTQCLKEKTLQRLNGQIVGNILLKVNSKLDGFNHKFQARPPILNRPCMIMGADVTHPSPDAQNIPSVAAVTASHDANAFCYNVTWRLQPPKVEIIQDLRDIVVEHLRYFEKRCRCKPERIIFFRDGVSEGQFDQVKNAEIKAIQQACKIVQRDDYEPRITFLVVQKRHHTRLFPLNPRDSEDKNNNVPAGTCVDTHIVDPTIQNFYLVSHASIQGVAKPTKYCTLHDDNNLDSDAVQQLTYHLCHMFTRCNRSVSYPAPTYYAHLAAARGKVYIENENLDMTKLKEYQIKYKISDKILTYNPMFFV